MTVRNIHRRVRSAPSEIYLKEMTLVMNSMFTSRCTTPGCPVRHATGCDRPCTDHSRTGEPVYVPGGPPTRLAGPVLGHHKEVRPTAENSGARSDSVSRLVKAQRTTTITPAMAKAFRQAHAESKHLGLSAKTTKWFIEQRLAEVWNWTPTAYDAPELEEVS